MDREKKNSILRQISQASCIGFEKTEMQSARRCLGRIKSDYRRIKDIRDDFEKRGFDETSCTVRWLSDNFYLIESTFEVCRKELAVNRKIAFVGGAPRVFTAFERFCNYADFAIDSEAISSVIGTLDSSYALSLSELFLSPYLALGAIISACRRVICEYERQRVHEKADEDKYSRSLSELIESLRYVSVHCFDKNILACRCARILDKDPAGAFPKMTDASKLMYLGMLRDLSMKNGVSEEELAMKLLADAENAADERERHVGSALLTLPKRNKYLYFLFVAGLPAIITLGLAFLSPFFLLSFFPLWEAFKGLSDFIFPKFIKSTPLPRMELSEIPEDSAVLVVITSLLTGEKNDSALFDRLERIFRANSGKNIYFGLLADIKDSKTANAPGDEDTVNYAYGRTNALCSKYGDNFVLFERRRSYSKSEEVFMGWERKRGAVCELVSFLKGMNTTFTERSKNLAAQTLPINKIKYIVTLDADTNLGLCAVKDMCSAMLHPLAKPYVDKEKGIVVKGYGIMQPRCVPELSAAGATPFSGIMCGEGGSNIYSLAAYDAYQSIFGEGIFCGKGIFDVDTFYDVIIKHNTFPEDKILSHDSLEGAKLRSALISDIELTDGFPGNQLSFAKRLHRWIRGDIQNLAYLFPSITFSENDKRRNNITGLSKFKLFDNARSASVPIFAVLGVFCSAFVDGYPRSILMFASLFYITIPFLCSLISQILALAATGITRRFFSRGVTTGVWQSFIGMLFSLSMLPMSAFVSADAIFKAAYRSIVTKKRLLEWQTFADGNAAENGLLLYVHKNIICAFSGFLLFVIAPAGFLRALSVLWFAFPVISYHTSHNGCLGKKKSESDEVYLEKSHKYAADIWNFFKSTVTAADNHLPPDNIQLAPREAVAHRTSPTNIGLYLISVLCARDFGFITTEELEQRIERTLDTVEKLSKYKGHLFNWYDTETLAVLAPFYVSTVDSGNLTACLITLRGGLTDYVNESTSLLELINRIKVLEDSTDYSFLYNKERNLFSLGAQITKDNKELVNSGCYDLMMSEARTISYIQCAKRAVPKKHWTSLSRALVTKDGYIGLSSWSGTAFEYYMPHLFIPVCKRSLCGEALCFAHREQQGKRAKRFGKEIFGVSESACYSFDGEMNYRYHAFGISSLALCEWTDKEFVISPYSSFLGLCINSKKNFANLDVMSEIGMYGKYGLYEAIDFTSNRCPEKGSVVKSYMAHHMGMSLCALCNRAFGNILQKRFMSDSAMKCATELLEEKIPVNVVVRKLCKKRETPKMPAVFVSEGKIYTRPDYKDPKGALLSNGSSRIFLSDTGHVEITNGDILVNYCDFDKYESADSLFCFANYGGKTVSATPLPNINPEQAEYSLRCSPGSTAYTARIQGLCEFGESFTMSRNDSTVFCVRAELYPKKQKKDDTSENPIFAFCFTPVIARKEDYLSHVSFSSLFVSCEYLANEKMLLYKRRPRAENDRALYLGAALSDSSCDFDFTASLEECFCAPLTCESFRNIFDAPYSKNRTGTLIRPYCRIRVLPKKDGEKFTSELLLCQADSVSKVISSINAARGKSFEEKATVLAEITDKFCSNAGTGLFGSERSPSAFERMLPAVCGITFGKSNVLTESLQFHGKGHLWKHGISGDLPIIVIAVISERLVGRIEKYVRAFKLLKLCGLRTDMCIVYSEKERYRKPVNGEICGIIEECDCRELISKRNGGIFLIDRSIDPDAVRVLFDIACVKADILYEGNDVSDDVKVMHLNLPITAPVLSVDVSMTERRVIALSSGYFSENSFTVRKDREFKVPFSHILTGRRMSCIVTHNSLGYTWVSNAQNRRITPFRDNPLKDMNGERILLRFGNRLYDLCAMARYVTFSAGLAEYDGYASGVRFKLSVYVSEKLCAKYVDVSLEFPAGSTEKGELMYLAVPIMGRHSSETAQVKYCITDNLLCFGNPFSEFFGEWRGFVTGRKFGEYEDENVKYVTNKSEIFANIPNGSTGICDCACAVLKVSAHDKCEYRFVLGAFHKDMSEFEKLFEFMMSGTDEKNATIGFAKKLIPNIRIIPKGENSIVAAYSALYNTFLPYQSSAGRFLARSGFYQSSGAFGFRDQLQDCLCLMYSKPDMVKSHIYRCCMRQFPEGDVLHWWHECDKGSLSEIICKGVRTLCSDDYLWLPFVVSEFYEYCGDDGFLSVNVHFANGEKLVGSDVMLREKYMEITRAKESDTVYGHCRRALDRGIERLGMRGLPLIGSCDWCDGYSNVGTDTEGESVWLGMFLCITLEKFCGICKRMADHEALDRYTHARLELIRAIEAYGYSEDEGQYVRAYFADGDKLGSLSSEECRTDLLPQSFAPASYGLSGDRVYTVAKNAFERLFDEKYSIFKLFTPAFEVSRQNPGYVKGYVEGVRENGGQYTHAAVWGAMGLCVSADILYRQGSFKKAHEIREMAKKAINAQNTVLRCMGALGERAKTAYNAEPYYLAGDIYSNRDFPGRAGWTIYTGSASWYYVLILRCLFGITVTDTARDAKLEIASDTPYVDRELCCGAILNIELKKDCRYSIEFCSGEKSSVVVDGEVVVGKFRMLPGNHTVVVTRPCDVG